MREGFILEIYRRYKQIIFYLVFGALTTLVNIITYFICTKLLGMEYLVSSFIAWLFAVIFAYITNKVYVFNSIGSKSIVWEFFAFVGCRLFSGSLDLSMMYIMVDLLYINDLVAKVIANVVVIVLNYIFGKLLFLKMRTRVIEENESIWKKYLS
ncbi:MAG: GtrA family protein [Desulfosporosinus sp.]